MCKLYTDVLSHTKNNTLSFLVGGKVTASMDVGDFESGFGLVASVTTTQGDALYYYRLHSLTETMMKIRIADNKLSAVFGMCDLFEEELKPLVNSQ